MKLSLIFLILLSISLSSYSPSENKTKVSWYGPGFHGKTTASGEVYNQNAMTCASPTLPFNTKVKIIYTTNKETKFVTVRINDRGPFAVHKNGKVVRPLKPHPTRAFDLSKAAFSKLTDTNVGVITVTYIIL